MKEYKTVLDMSQGRYEEKRSVFIAELFPCENVQQAAEIVSSQKTKYWDARHVVHAYNLCDGSVKAADDGEPHGTSGKPVLDVITGAGLQNVLITVTRYFGGVLLGTGGLVRAYTAAAKDAVDNVRIVTMCPGIQVFCSVDYQQYQTIQRIIFAHNCIIDESEFGESVHILFTVPSENIKALKNEIVETFAGKVVPQYKKDLFFVKK